MITSLLNSISSQAASLPFEDAGSIALALARQSPEKRNDDVFLITELLAASAINLVHGVKEGEQSSAPASSASLQWTIAAAINILLLHSFDAAIAVQWTQPSIESAYLPLLASNSGLEASQREQTVAGAVSVIVHAHAWQYSLELLKSCFDIADGDDFDSFHSSVLLIEPGMIQLCSKLIDAVPTTGGKEGEENENENENAAAVLYYAADVIFPLALSTLACSSTKNTNPTLAAIGQSLLPSALSAAKKVGKLSTCLTILWSTCQRLGQSESLSEIRNGLSLLVQFCQPLLQHANIAQDSALWDLLLCALRSDQGLNRKRALHVLENAIAQLQEEQRDLQEETFAAWGTFIRLFITVDDTSLHLFKEAWPEIDRLHPPAAETSAASDVIKNGSKESKEKDSLRLPLPVPWILLLWNRALQHRLLTAQKLAALSFLERVWPEEVLAQVPPSFCFEVLLPVLGQGVIQRGDYSEEIKALVPIFFQKWSRALPREERLDLLKILLDTLAGQQQQQAKMKFAYTALIAAATVDNVVIFEAEHQAELVRGATAAAAAQPSFGANAIALKIYAALISALASCVLINSVEMLYLVTSFLSAIPVPLLHPGGLLCTQLVDWFSQKSHASLLPTQLENLVNLHLDSLKAVSLGSLDSQEIKKGGPNQRQIAYGALVLAEAVAAGAGGSSNAEACLNAVFSKWKLEFYSAQKEDGQAATVTTAALPLLAALLAAVKELPAKKEIPRALSSSTSTSNLKMWLSTILFDICDALIGAVDTTYAVWLLSMTQRASLETMSSYIEVECAARNISKDEAFNNDDVLPSEFVERRNEACNALACIAGAPPLLFSENGNSRNSLAAAKKYAACAARFVKMCCTGYSELFEDFSSDSVDKRVRLEAAIAVLRPLVACSHSMAWPSENREADGIMSDVNGSIESKDIVLLVSSLLDELETARAYMPNTPAARKIIRGEKTKLSKKKKKNSWKLEPLTLHSWHNVLSWRALEAFVANNAAAVAAGSKSQIFPLELQGRIFASAILGISGAPEGSNSVIPYIRCLRAMIPSLVQNSEAMVPAIVVAAAKASAAAAAAAGGSTSGDENGENSKKHIAEKQQYHELVFKLLAAGGNATLNDVVGWMGGALLFGLNAHLRKRTGMTAAVLSCCLHPCFFHPGQEALHQNGGENGAVGAVRNIVKGFFEASTRHSRTFVLFSTQFSALLAAFPAIGAVYCDVVVDLLRMGFDEEGHLQSLDDAVLDEPTAAELTALLEPLDPALAKAHMASYAAPRVGSLCLLHSWVHEGLLAAENFEEKDKNSEALVGLAAAKEIWGLLFNLAMADPELNTGRYLHRGPTHRQKLRVWQALTVLCPAVPSSAAAETLTQMLDALDIPNAATVKQFQEIVALKMIKIQPDLLESCLLPRISNYFEQRNEACPSLMSIAAVSAFIIAKEDEKDTVLEETKKKELIKKVVSAMLPWSATFVHGSRTFAQLVVWRMGEVYPWLQEQDASYAAFYKFFSTNLDLKRLRGAMGVDFGLDNFDFERATSPKGILCEESALLGTSNTGGPLEGVPVPLMDCLLGYLAQEKFALRYAIEAKMADFALNDEIRRNAIEGEQRQEKEKALANANGSKDTPATTGADFYQRKITPSDKEAAVIDPWGAALGLAALSSSYTCSINNNNNNNNNNNTTVATTTTTTNKGVDKNAVVIDNFEADPLRRAVDEAIATAQTKARQELIIVASLIDKVPNLAGLARTCEVFRASKLVLADVSITTHPQFASISVSAEHWVPIEQVSPIVLAPWLRKKATEGYTLVGLEQTAESTRLQEYIFPKKTVLLLGAEKEGVPADLLQLLDATVEIPQSGVVRSLNVHVSAAIGIYEFTRQSLEAAKAAASIITE